MASRSEPIGRVRLKATEFHDAQQIDRERRVVLDRILDLEGLRVARGEVDEAGSRSSATPTGGAGDQLGTREVAAGKERKPISRQRSVAACVGTPWPALQRQPRQRSGQRLQRRVGVRADVDLDDVDQRQQRRAAFVESGVIGERQRIAAFAQRPTRSTMRSSSAAGRCARTPRSPITRASAGAARRCCR